MLTPELDDVGARCWGYHWEQTILKKTYFIKVSDLQRSKATIYPDRIMPKSIL